MKKICLLATIVLFGAVSSHALPVLSDQQIRAGYANCMAFLKMSPAQKLRVAKASHHSLSAIQNACVLQKRTGLARTIELNHEYDRWQRSQRSSSGGSPSWANPAPVDDGKVKPSLQPGTCYDITGCNGRSVHVNNGPSDCPASFSAFEYDMGGDGCRSL